MVPSTPEEHQQDTTTVWLVRHGQSTWNVAHRIQGADDTATLTHTGRGQARRLARTLARPSIGTVISSDLRRARQTAAPLARRLGLTVTVDPRLRERGFGELEGLPSSLLTTRLSGIDGETVVDPDAHPTGGESLRDVMARTDHFLDWLHQTPQPGDVVLVVHGGSLRTLAAGLRGVPVESLRWEPVDNCTVLPLELHRPSDPSTVATTLRRAP